MLVNLFLIEAPFQLVSAMQAAKSVTEGERVLLVRKTGFSRADAQTEQILSEYRHQWDRIICIDTTPYLKALTQLLKLRLAYIARRRTIEIVAVGDYRSSFCHVFYRLFRGRRLWLLDDGIGLLNLYNYNLDKLRLNREAYKDNKLINYHTEKINSGLNKEIVLKTFLKIPTNPPFICDKTDLTDAFQIAKCPSQTVNPKLVYFLGAKLVDDNLLDQDGYQKVCKKVADRFSELEITYLPHRGENDKSVSEICQRFGFKLLRPKLPIEFHMCQESILPKHVVAISSAALVTISEIYPAIKIIAIDFDRSHLTPSINAGFNVCFRYLNNTCTNLTLWNH